MDVQTRKFVLNVKARKILDGGSANPVGASGVG